MASFNIAIIGAGPAGCTLARLLLRSPSAIRVTVFEAETSPNARSQGGTLDLQESTGLRALREAGLYDEFRKFARFDGEAMKISDKKAIFYVNMGGATEGKGRGSPEIDRVRLREILFKSLPDGVIRWGCPLRSIDEDLKLHFDHGVEDGFDLVVGADGAWSKVRPLLHNEKPFYSGISGFQLTVPNAKDHPDLDKLVNRGSLFVYSDGKHIGGQQMGDGSLHVASWAVGDELPRNEQGPVLDGLAVKEKIMSTHLDWAPEIMKLIEVASSDSITARSLYMLPVGIQWENRPGVTLLGDAAHLMTPFAGVGVNAALEDAMHLAHSIMEPKKLGTKEALAQSVIAFEKEMFRRGTEMQELTYRNMNDMLFTPGAPRTTVASYMIRSAKAKAGIDGWKLSLVGVAIYVYMFFFKLFHK